MADVSRKKTIVKKFCGIFLVAFVVAYGLALLVVVWPIIVMETSVGQLTGRGPIQALYNICPVFKGTQKHDFNPSIILIFKALASHKSSFRCCSCLTWHVTWPGYSCFFFTSAGRDMRIVRDFHGSTAKTFPSFKRR